MENQQNQKPILVVSKNDSGQRVDNYLFKKRKNLDKSTCYKLMRKGQIRINGKRIKPHQKLVTGDEVRLPPFVFFTKTQKVLVDNKQQNLLMQSVIFENNDFLVLNKPAGISVHKGTGNELGVIEIINSIRQYKDTQLAHRLDKETSGCLLLAKNRQALLSFQDAMKKNSVEKIYVAIVEGLMSKSVVCQKRLNTDNRINGFRHVVISESGKSASTRFDPIKSNQDYTLVECQITHGRTHQIRVHAKDLGHPVLGDRIYGKKQLNLPRQLYLHAHRLSFEDINVISPVPVSFNLLI